jgi:hypothetical protein
VNDVLVIALKAAAGGGLVVAFALLSDVLQPKSFSGLFSAAPSIAMASLLITALASGHSKAADAAGGMITGAAGMVGYCIVATVLVERFGSVVGSALAWSAWLAAAAATYTVLFR